MSFICSKFCSNPNNAILPVDIYFFTILTALFIVNFVHLIISVVCHIRTNVRAARRNDPRQRTGHRRRGGADAHEERPQETGFGETRDIELSVGGGGGGGGGGRRDHPRQQEPSGRRTQPPGEQHSLELGDIRGRRSVRGSIQAFLDDDASFGNEDEDFPAPPPSLYTNVTISPPQSHPLQSIPRAPPLPATLPAYLRFPPRPSNLPSTNSNLPGASPGRDRTGTQHTDC